MIPEYSRIMQSSMIPNADRRTLDSVGTGRDVDGRRLRPCLGDRRRLYPQHVRRDFHGVRHRPRRLVRRRQRHRRPPPRCAVVRPGALAPGQRRDPRPRLWRVRRRRHRAPHRAHVAVVRAVDYRHHCHRLLRLPRGLDYEDPGHRLVLPLLRGHSDGRLLHADHFHGCVADPRPAPPPPQEDSGSRTATTKGPGHRQSSKWARRRAFEESN
mmetsp:Transcript_25998/g.84204  ORF Transcript_25998/g.84204 Transcript_25998/m.84204 type:complete len:212 (-) Transcript_25998:966-1601(-)